MTTSRIIPEPAWGLPSPHIEDDDIYEDGMCRDCYDDSQEDEED